MSFSDDQKKILKQNGYTQSAYDSDRYINGGHSVTKRDGTTIFNTDRHTSNGSNISNSLFSKKAK
ncbi:MAG: hypothetical protein V4663_14710 [Bacteroidota bacterium]